MKRRELLLSSGGVTAALLAGRIPTAQAREETANAQGQFEAAETALDLLPAASELDSDYVRIVYTSLDGTDEADELTYEAAIVEQIDGLAVSDAEEVVTVWTEDQLSLGSITGTFERPEPGDTVDEPGEWWVGHGEDDTLAIASTDDHLVFARHGETDEHLDAVETSCDVVRNGGDTVLETMDRLDEAFDRLGDNHLFYFITDLEGGISPTVSEQVQKLGAGFEESPTNARGNDERLENQYLLEMAADADLDDEDVEEILQQIEQGTLVDVDTEFDGDVVFVEAVVEPPPERDRQAAPGASIVMAGDPDAGTAEIEHRSGEPIPAEELELWVNGELAGVQPADEFDEFAPGDLLTVDTGPLASVFLRWFDQEENEFFGYVSDVVGQDAFDVRHDPEAESVELTYTAEMDADPDILRLVHRRRIAEAERRRTEREERTEPIDALGGTLSTGDSIVVDGVEIEDTVSLNLDIPLKPAGTFGPDTNVVSFRVRPPRIYIRRRPEESPVIGYHDDTSRDADEFRVLVDGDDADTQPGDEHETLEQGDQVRLGEVEFGSEVAVEWTVAEDPVVLDRRVVKPLFHLETSYDDENGSVTITHMDGEAVDADNLELHLDSEPAGTQPGDEHDVFGPADTVSVSAEPFTHVEVRWGDEPTDTTLYRTVVGEGLFEASYDFASETAELVYTGEQTADPSDIEVDRFGRGTAENDGDQPLDGIETLTSGDTVTIEDVDPDETIRVVHTDGESRQTPVFRFRVSPRHAFDFEREEGTVVAEYRPRVSRDADEFRVLVDGDEADAQPGDEHETLEQGDTFELGAYPPGTTIVIEWPTSGDPTGIQEHVVTPEAEFSVSYEDDGGELRIEHAGGDGIDADDLGVHAPPVTEELVDWDGDGTVTEGDSTTIEAEETPEELYVVFRDRELLYQTEFDD